VLIAKDKPAQQKRIIEFLARDSDVPTDEIERLCVKEQAGLEASARLKHFLPIFMVRNVREQLRQSRIKGPTPAAEFPRR
jgi:Protein of unknown function (DUF3562)